MITIGIIGAGIVGERLIKQIQQEARVTIEAVYDERPERLEFLRDSYGIPVVDSIEAVLYSNIDWLYIGTPPAAHADIAKRAADSGIHVLSEKPLAHDAASAEGMVASADENRIRTAMHFPLMYSPEVHEMVKRIRSGSIGRVKRIELQTFFPDWPRTWQQNPWIASRSQGGFVREVFPHYLQLINRVFGKLDIQAHHITYPEQPELCEIGIIAHGLTQAGIPFLLTGLSGIGQQELLQFKVYGDEGVLTLENWSKLYHAEKDQERKAVTDSKAVPSLFDAMQQQSTFLVPFEEGLVVQRYIEHLLAE